MTAFRWRDNGVVWGSFGESIGVLGRGKLGDLRSLGAGSMRTCQAVLRSHLLTRTFPIDLIIPKRNGNQVAPNHSAV